MENRPSWQPRIISDAESNAIASDLKAGVEAVEAKLPTADRIRRELDGSVPPALLEILVDLADQQTRFDLRQQAEISSSTVLTIAVSQLPSVRRSLTRGKTRETVLLEAVVKCASAAYGPESARNLLAQVLAEVSGSLRDTARKRLDRAKKPAQAKTKQGRKDK